MRLLKELHRTFVWAAVLAVLVFSMANTARADIPGPAPSACTGVDTTTDCTAVLGHISASVVGTLSINEARGISFGNMAVACAGVNCAGTSTLTLSPAGIRTVANGTDTITLLYGNNNNGVGSGPTGGALDTGGQSPGIYHVTGGGEGTLGAQEGVYISFADNAGNPVDYSGDDFWTGNDQNIQVTGAGGEYFTVDDFTFNQSGSDVFGHYIDTTGGAVDVYVGATLHTDANATTYAPGPYRGTYIVMVSY